MIIFFDGELDLIPRTPFPKREGGFLVLVGAGLFIPSAVEGKPALFNATMAGLPARQGNLSLQFKTH